jgi:serine/threonine protein kinase
MDLEQFVASLYQSGILPAREIQSFFDEIPEDRCPSTADEMAAEMVRARLLTRFQADALVQGRSQGLVLGNYVLLDPLGKGGMGGVFRGMHRGMKRIVALKVLLPRKMKTADSVERFQREVEAMARLSHPNIVAAFDAGEHSGLRYLAMEYVEGKDLSSLVAEHGVLPVATAVDYLFQTAQGLQYAHWHGMVHRDVKPANLMLDWRGTIKILALGIVGLVPGIWETGPGSEGAGRQSAGLGTPDYIAPEQLAARDALGPQCDVYSLGCTLHFLLVGRPVFAGETTEAKLLAHRNEPAPSLRAARPDAPESLDRLFQRMLAKQPADRPATMDDVMAELEGCLQAIRAAETAAGQTQRGLLVIHVREPDLAIQVADQWGNIVMDCPATEGTLQVAIPPGRYCLVVRKGDEERLAETIEMGDSGSEVIEVPKP